MEKKNFLQNKFMCPSCNGHINPFGKIILIAKSKIAKGIIYLSETLGDYTLKKSNELIWERGEIITLSCPICGHIFNDIKDYKEASLLLIRKEMSGEKKYIVKFSAVVEENFTFLLSENLEILQHWHQLPNNQEISKKLAEYMPQ